MTKINSTGDLDNFFQNPASMTEENSEMPPDFCFLGTDGEYYQIGKSPRSFIKYIYSFFKNQDVHKLPADEWLDEVDKWIHMHLVVVEGQMHLSLEDIPKLYFAEDLPQILNFILRRFHIAHTATLGRLYSFAESLEKVAEPSEADLQGDENPSNQDLLR
jgi:hypothetical protein